MVRTAVLFALVGTVSWCVWALFADFSTRTLAPEVAMAVSYAVGVGVALTYIAAQSGRCRSPVRASHSQLSADSSPESGR